MLTPKLLPDLEYSEACTLLNIMTGPWIEQPAEGKDVTQKSVLYIETLQFIYISTQNLIFFYIPNSVWSSGDCWGNIIGLVGKSQC